MGCAASPRLDGKLALTDGITLSDEELRGEAGQADPIRSAPERGTDRERLM
jgi:hypothetical protein